MLCLEQTRLRLQQPALQRVLPIRLACMIWLAIPLALLNSQPSTLNPQPEIPHSHPSTSSPLCLCPLSHSPPPVSQPPILNPWSESPDPTPYTLKPLSPKYGVGDTCRTCFWQSSRSASNRACEFIREPQWQGSQAARRPAPSAVADAAAAFCALLSLMITWREDRAHHQRNLLDSRSQVPVSVER